jgi:O-antigen/teichoic acid export membrane protein
MKANVLKSGAIYAGANIASSGVPFVLLPILTRALTPDQYGEVVVFYLLVAMCSALAGLGLHAAVGVRWLDASRGDPRSYTASAVVLVFISTLITAALAAAIGPALGFQLRYWVCALAAVMAGATVLQNMQFAVWQSCHQPRRAAALQVSSALLNMGLSLLAVVILHLGSFGRILGATIAGIVVAASCLYMLRRDRAVTHARLADVKALLRFGLPLVPHTLSGSLLVNADRIAVSSQLGTNTLGIYGTASQLGMVMNVICDAAVKAYAPSMYRMLSQNSPRCRLRLVAITYLSIPVLSLVAMVLWGGLIEAGSLFLGDRYLAALDLAIWFIIGGAITGVYLNIAGLFFFSSKTEWISAATVTASLVAMIVAGPAVAHFGVVGGAVAYLSAQLTLLTCAWALSCRIRPMPWGRPILAVRVLFRKRNISA